MAVGVIFIVGGGGYYYFSTPPGVNVGIELPTKLGQVLLGDQFSFSVSALNYSEGILKAAKLSLSLLDGTTRARQSAPGHDDKIDYSTLETTRRSVTAGPRQNG